MKTGKIKTALPVSTVIALPLPGGAIAHVEIFGDSAGKKYVCAYLDNFSSDKLGNGLFRTMDYGSCDNDCPACYFVKLESDFHCKIGGSYRNYAEVLAKFLELMSIGGDDIYINRINDDTVCLVAELVDDHIKLTRSEPN